MRAKWGPLLGIHLGTNAGCADDGEEGVCLWLHSDLQLWETLLKLLLVLLCWPHSVHKNLKEGGTTKSLRDVISCISSQTQSADLAHLCNLHSGVQCVLD